jgi:hypothetical protein
LQEVLELVKDHIEGRLGHLLQEDREEVFKALHSDGFEDWNMFGEEFGELLKENVRFFLGDKEVNEILSTFGETLD